jgi:hypothetical protein
VSSNPQEGQVLACPFNNFFWLKASIMTSLQVTLALTNLDFKQKWGAHYARSLLSAHRLQQCHNYKVRRPSNQPFCP